MLADELPFSGKHILIIVENLPLPFDRRVWQEANTLKDSGAMVSIICPIMKGYTQKYEVINGIHIYRHRLPREANNTKSYLAEYLTALWWECWLSIKIYFKKRFHVIQGCNPPDLIFIPALFFKLFGVKYVFDHHDINPELYIAKYNKKGLFYRLLLLAEKLTFKTANFSIATNESYKTIAIQRGKMDPGKVQVVRSGPKLERLRLTDGSISYKKSRKYLVGYVGVIGEQEGLDLLLDSIQYVIRQRQDVQFAIIGDGTELNKIKELAGSMHLNNYIDFYGRVNDEILVDILNTADICVNPDKPTDMNNLSTMNKIMEYMALKKPIVQYDLKEGKFSAGQASLYAQNVSTQDFAEKIIWLIQHPEERAKMGNYGYNRVVNELSWKHEEIKLINFYKKVFNLKYIY
jgi:glycosyltransferase involved in cell wall biosynthesis